MPASAPPWRVSAPAACGPLVTPVTCRIDEEVLPTIDLASGMPVALEEGMDLETPRLTDHHELELRPLILEAISLQEPIAPLCEPDCPGLCPECGERLEAGHPDHDDPGRPAPRGAPGVPGRRRGRDGVDSPIGPTTLRSRVCAPGRIGAASIIRPPRGVHPRIDQPPRGARGRHGCAEAKGRSRAADGAPEPPRSHPADARRVPALPRAEAAAPGMPGLRVVQRPPGRRAEAGGRISRWRGVQVTGS